ncbi:MAG: DUF2339 domain-containing protein [Sphingomonas sp.]|uniref:DUF2339 domain-containing protein n=1 Tax=Sphingomonas sp. TaxID=28214 RepID=UPI0026015DC8|nr:DUF2339 domain-containing protein [Sphingomonas sp.]MBX9882710.1 DUF2339 domain-containing protein [Sphingomonas sp.]
MTSLILTLAMFGLVIVLLDLRKRLALAEERLRKIGFEVLRLSDLAAERPPAPAEPVDPPPSAAPTRWREAQAPPRVSPFALPTEREAVTSVPPPPVAAEPAPSEPVVREPDAPETQAEPGEPAGAEPAPVQTRRPAFGLEDLFGRRLPIWVGGITLIVAAVLLVKYTIETGLVTEPVRVMLGLIFGAGLIAGAEATRRTPALAADPRVAQALAGAGVGGLYASMLAAANLYALIAPELAFIGLSAVTGLALVLALRFGAPTAVLALVGGLATPALVRSDAPNLPLLSGYLGVVIGSLSLVSRRQRWFWLGVAGLVGGGGWILFVIAFFPLDGSAVLTLGLLALLLGFVLPVNLMPERRAPLQAGAALFAALQIALIVVQGGFAPLSWGLYATLALALLWLTGRAPPLRPLLALPPTTSFALVALWPMPPPGLLAAVLTGTVLVSAAPALVRVARRRGDWLDTGLLASVGLASLVLWLLRGAHPVPLPDVGLSALALACALPSALGVMLCWRDPSRAGDARFAVLLAPSALLVLAAALLGLPFWLTPVAAAFVAAALLAGWRTDDAPLVALVVRVSFGAAVVLLAMSGFTRGELTRLIMAAPGGPLGAALLRWGAVTAIAVALTRRERLDRARQTVEGHGVRPLPDPSYELTAAVLGYGLIAQFVPAMWLPISAALGVLALTEIGERGHIGPAHHARGTLALVVLGWAAAPLALWIGAALRSLAGMPMLVTSVPTFDPILRRLLLPVLILAASLWRGRKALPRLPRAWATGLFALLALITAHSLYKHLFALSGGDMFTAWGLAERTLWELLLVTIGAALARSNGGRWPALALLALAGGHWTVYSLALHNPFWASQAVGALPVANLLLPSLAVPALAVWAARRIDPKLGGLPDTPVQLGAMALILLFAYATLRQLFTGSLLNLPTIAPTENLLRSVLAIVLALGYLLWGIRRELRIWRLASLVLMVLAVAKVFLVDAAGLDGLLRIASFMGLGFSLIGIGWLYSRTLRG